MARDAARVGLGVIFRPGQADEVVLDLERLGVERLRARLSWAAWAGHEAEAARLLERLAAVVDLLPCVEGDVPGAGPGLADFVEAALARCGAEVAWCEVQAAGSEVGWV